MTDLDKWDFRYLDVAKVVASWSKDPSTQTGAVIVHPTYGIVATGFNGLARGVVDSEERLTNREMKYKMIVHAERNALVHARSDLSGCMIYVYPWMPCAVCAGMVIQAGIARCVAPLNLTPRWQEDFALTEEMFREARVALKLTPEVS